METTTKTTISHEQVDESSGFPLVETRAFQRTMLALFRKIPVCFHVGGTSSGKTYGILFALIVYYWDNVVPKVISIASENVPHLKRGVWRDAQEILAILGLWEECTVSKSERLITFPNGNKIEFIALDDEGKARGGRRSCLFVNEVTNVKFSIFLQMEMRTDGPVILDWNPSHLFWVYDKYLPTLDAGDYLVTKSTYRDNPALSQKIVDRIERLKDIDDNLYRVYGMGELGQNKGLIYTNWTMCDEFPTEAKRDGYGMDFGFANSSTALVRCAIIHGKLYLDELIYETGMTNQDISNRFKSLGINGRKVVIADSAEPKSIEEIRRDGYNVIGVKKTKDFKMYGINLIKQHGIVVTKRSTNIIKELRNYQWKEKDGEQLNEPIKAFDHAMDAMLYWVVMNVKRYQHKEVGMSF